jgi:hypothetical protein
VTKSLAFGVAAALLASGVACSGSSGGKAHPTLSSSPLPDRAGLGTVSGTFKAVGGPPGAPDSPQRGRLLVRYSGRVVMTVHVEPDGHYEFLIAPGIYRIVGYSPQYGSGRAPCDSYPSSFKVRAGHTKHIDVLCQRI